MGTSSWHSELPSVNTFAFLSLLSLPIIDRHIFLISLHYTTLFFWNHLMRSEIRGLVDERLPWQFTNQATTEDVVLWKVSRICLLSIKNKSHGFRFSIFSTLQRGFHLAIYKLHTTPTWTPVQVNHRHRKDTMYKASSNKFSYSWGRIISFSNFIIPKNGSLVQLHIEKELMWAHVVTNNVLASSHLASRNLHSASSYLGMKLS